MTFYNGKHVTIDQKHPKAVAICDYSSFVHLHKDLVKQMEWRGNRLVWTGFLVGKDYADIPNPQLKPPILRPDPVPVKLPRPPQGQEMNWNNIYQNWNDDQQRFNEIASLSDGVYAPSNEERLEEARNAYFGSYGE